MRILIDTNVYVSAFSFRSPDLLHLLVWCLHHHELAITDYLASEILRVTEEKRPGSELVALEFLRSPGFLWIEIPEDFQRVLDIPDPKDQPILDACMSNEVEIVISGDKHFRRMQTSYPSVMKPNEFIAEFIDEQR